MKKYLSGFVPVNFKQTGKILLIIGLVCLAVRLLSFLTNWFSLSNNILYVGIGLILLSLYLFFVVPKE